jgi:TatD DNase family protein
LLLETDAPYLLPRTLSPKPRTRRNEPAYLSEVLRVVANCMQEDVEVVATASTRNAERLFRLAGAA